MMEVVAGTLLRENRFLAAQRRSGLWEFPGGKVEIGETIEEGLVREVREELSIHAEVLAFVGMHESSRLRVSLFLMTSDEEPQPHEHLSLAWVDAQSALLLPWQPHDLPLLESLLAVL